MTCTKSTSRYSYYTSYLSAVQGETELHFFILLTLAASQQILITFGIFEQGKMLNVCDI